MRQQAAERKQRVPAAPAPLTRSARQELARPTVPAELPEPQQQAELAAQRRELTAEQAESQARHPKAELRSLPAQRPVS